MQYLTSYIVVQAICLSAAFWLLRGQRFNVWGVQRFYLLVVVATELGGIWLRGMGKSNLALYNAFLWVEALAVGALLCRFIQPITSVPMHRVYLIWVVLFGLSYGLEWRFNSQEYLYFNYTIVLMCFVFTLACTYYAYRMLVCIPVQDITRHAPFWWVSGTVIFYFGGTMVNGVLDLLIDRPLEVGGYYLHQLIVNFLNILMYGLWTYSYVIYYRHPNS